MQSLWRTLQADSKGDGMDDIKVTQWLDQEDRRLERCRTA